LTDAIDLIEVGGRGGVYQHTLAVARVLQDQGLKVRVITATDPELLEDDLRIERVLDWSRDARSLRSSRIVWSFFARVLPSAIRGSRDVWVQGSFKPPLTLLLLALLRCVGKRTTYSPHNLFERHGGVIATAASAICLRLASQVAVYNSVDRKECGRRRITVVQIPLIMHVAQLNETAVAKWEAVVEVSGTRVCSVGQIRSDKNLDMLLGAAGDSGTPILVAGEDAGGLGELEKAAHPTSLIFPGYLTFDDFAAILYVVGTVALPYTVASQSGVAVVARAYGCHILGTGVGGLGDQVDEIVPDLDRSTWASALASQPDRTRVGQPLPRAYPATEDEAREILRLF